MEKTEISLEVPTAIGGVIIVPIVKTTASGWKFAQALSFSGHKQPLGLIVISPLAKKGFGMDGEEVPLERFINMRPEIGAFLDQY
jgi:hypothetical protein